MSWGFRPTILIRKERNEVIRGQRKICEEAELRDQYP
jgi:hypothetical protein